MIPGLGTTRFPLPLAAVAALLFAVACTTPFDVDARRHDAGTDVMIDRAVLDVVDTADTTVTDSAGDVTLDRVDAPVADTTGEVVESDASSCGACDRGLCCGARCVDPEDDPDNCGACGNACPGTACLGGSCTGTCVLGSADCDHNAITGCERDLATDRENCGACGVACGIGRVCTMGRCECVAGTADCDTNPTNGCEVTTATDAQHCGACGTPCGPHQTCSAGVCGCASGFADCDGMPATGCETDLGSSSTSCGTCGHNCGARSVCTGGVCGCQPGNLACPPGSTGGCDVSATDPLNCGACGTVCGADAPVCTAAGCGTGCASGETRCGDSCVVLDRDLGNCGGCGHACPSPAHTAATCAMGTCGFACATGFADCDGTPATGCEAALASDSNNCGACGLVCPAGRTCSGGACACPVGTRDCGGGVCAACCNDAQCDDGNPCNTDVCAAGSCTHSTGCGGGLLCCTSACRACCADSDCTTPGRGCGADGTCSVCRTGFADCDGVPANGCETDTRVSTMNCGACGAACSFANAGATCAAGHCAMTACSPGFADCNGDPSDGCEINLANSLGNCGSCGSVCAIPGAMSACVGGACVRTSCSPGLGDCDSLPANGCETMLAMSLANCGACGNRCSFTNAGAACVSNTCVLGGCNAGFGDCDTNAANGCETDTTSSSLNCGACSRPCSLPQATASCVSSACQVAGCTAGYGDCDNGPANGCETDLRTTVASCGACGNVCASRANAATTCSGGACGFACNGGYADCNSSGADGCEANLATSVTSCGTCGHACGFANASASCVGGTCAIGSCAPGFGDCDANPADGCEVNIASSVTNCGACGHACSVPHASGACSMSTCGLGTCAPGYLDCNHVLADGCEANCGPARACAATGTSCAPGWVAMGTSPLSARAFPFYAIAPSRHELLVWGGSDSHTPTPNYFADGAAYNWDTGTWRAMSASPLSARAFGTAVWTGGELFVWGGHNATTSLADGALYNPSTDAWRMVNNAGAPSSRAGYEAVLAGNVVLVNAGQSDSAIRTDGGRFDPATNTWTALHANTSDTARAAYAYTGSALLQFGGDASTACGMFSGSPTSALSSYVVGTDHWTLSPVTASRPGARWFEGFGSSCVPYAWVAPWTGSQLFVWGGQTGSGYASNGALYDPATDRWTATSAAPAPLSSGAFLPITVWTGSRVLGWSPVTSSAPQDVVYTFDPATGTWTTPSYAGAPTPVYQGAAYGWTGNALIVWGGRGTAGVSSRGGLLVP